MPNRRETTKLLATALAAAPLLQIRGTAAQDAGDLPHDAGSNTYVSRMPEAWRAMMGRGEQAAMLLYPGFTALDLVGPQYAFASTLGLKVHLVAKSQEPVMSDTGLAVAPTVTFDACPRDLTLLFAPGGLDGTLDAIRDHATLAFVADRGERAQWVTSVCTGSLILGAAGLLRGYRATSHWLTRHLLPLVGAEPVDQRVVFDHNRVTGAGVTAGLDFGLALVGHLRGETYARAVQLMAEYAPEPPYRAGSPNEAGQELADALRHINEPFQKRATATLESQRR